MAPRTRTRLKDHNGFLYKDVPSPLPDDGRLPTHEEVDKQMELFEEVSKTSGKKTKTEDIEGETVDAVMTVWSRLCPKIKIMKKSHIIQKLRRYRKERVKRLKNIGIRKETDRKKNMKRKSENPIKKSHFEDLRPQLFDISTKDLIPKSDLVFYKDQTRERNLRRVVFYKDQTGERNLRRVVDVAPQDSSSPEDLPSTSAPSSSCPRVLFESLEDNGSEVESEVEEEYSKYSEESLEDNYEGLSKREISQLKKFQKPKSRGKGGIDLKVFEAGERFQVSRKGLTALQGKPESEAYSETGLRKLQSKAYQEAVDAQNFTEDDFIAIGFDEKIDKTLVKDPENPKRTLIKSQEHCSVVGYFRAGGNKFIGHFEPKGRTGKDLGESLYEFLVEKKINLDKVQALVSDGCRKMTGWDNGAHKYFEDLLGRGLQRVLCFFHHLEKSFFGMARVHGFSTTGPSGLSDYWQQTIQGDIHLKDLVDFNRVEDTRLMELLNSMTPEAISNLSTDFRIIVGLLLLILTGEDKAEVASRKIGLVVKSRWVTTEARVLRAYVSDPNPAESLIRLVLFLVKVWAPVLILTKLHQDKGYLGPYLLLTEVKLAREVLFEEEFKSVLNHLNENGFYAHPENILLHLLNSSNFEDRRAGVRIIQGIREKRNKPPVITKQRKNARQAKKIREFKAKDYKINPEAKSVLDLPENGFSDPTEPPVTMQLSDSELLTVLTQPLSTNLPVSSTAVERAVRNVSDVSKRSICSKKRDGMIFLTLQARAKSNNK